MNETYPIGTIAVITPDDEPAILAFRMNGFWATPTRERMVTTGDAAVTDAHPLVVIDPDDREQRRRLAECIASAESYRMRDYHEPDYEVLADALREFANPTPPKPDEPTGLGAVVEDPDGKRWVRALETTTVRHWQPTNRKGDARTWEDFTSAVRVLSEGVQA